MLQLPPKQQNLLQKCNINREEKRNRDEKPGEKINPEGGAGLILQFFRRNYRRTFIIVGGIKFRG
jgi:hypothetical protein